MITDYPQDFIDAMNSTSRKPIQLAEFYLLEEVFYLSDCEVGIGDGLAQNYMPWVESWGTLADNTQLSDVFNGNSLEIRSCTITLIMSPQSSGFIRYFFAKGIENTKVKLYQWFRGMTSPPQLIDVFVCQDPIRISESSMLFQVDLVSPLMATNPQLWPPPVGIQAQPVVIGKAIDMPLIDLQTARKTGLGSDVDATEVGTWFVDNGVGFPASGFVSIDSEAMAYSWISASAINITARAQQGTTGRPHYRGALVVPYGELYDYAICAGPVMAVDNMKGNGEPYINPYEVFVGQNPVIARFTGRPPWLKVEPGQGGDPIVPPPATNTEYGAATETTFGGGSPTVSSAGSINSASGAATMTIERTLSGGSGSYTRTPQTWTSVNCTGSATNFTGLIAGTNGQVYSKASTAWGDIVDGVIGSRDGKYGVDDTLSYGTPTAVSVDVKFGTLSELIASHSKVRVIHVKHDGSTVTLEEWVVDGLNYIFGDAYRPPWYNKTINYVLSGITTFAQLKETKIRIELENVESKTGAEYASVSDRCFVDADATFKVNYYKAPGTAVDWWQELLSHFNRNLSSLGAITNVTIKVKASFTLTNAIADLKIVRRSTSSTANNVVLWSQLATSTSIPATERVFNLGTMSWTDLQNLRIGIYQLVSGPDDGGTTQKLVTSFEYVQWVITYQPGAIPTPDEERVVYAETMTCDVTSLIGADPTPPEAIRWLIENQSQSGQYIDVADFDSAHAAYDAISYYLNGVIGTNTRLHDALRIVLDEGMCRLLFNQGRIKLLSYFEQKELNIDVNVSEDLVLLRSRLIENQPISQINNKWTVRYGRHYIDDVYAGKVVVEDSESISRFQLIDTSKDLTLVSTEAIAQLFADRMLALTSRPISVYSLAAFMGAMIAEKGDVISFRSMLDKRYLAVGGVLSTARTFGAGKLGQINTIKLMVYNPEIRANIDLFDFLAINDAALEASRLIDLDLVDYVVVFDGNITAEHIIELAESLALLDSVTLVNCEPNGYGSCGYGYFPYGV